jgi:hypothetical protein
MSDEAQTQATETTTESKPAPPPVDKAAIDKLVDQKAGQMTQTQIDAQLRQQQEALQAMQAELAQYKEKAEQANNSASVGLAEKAAVLFDPNATEEQAFEAFKALGEAAQVPREQLDQMISSYRSNSTVEEARQTQETETHEDPELENYKQYSRELQRERIENARDKQISDLIDNDPTIKALYQIKAEKESAESAQKMVDNLKAEIKHRSTEALNRKWSQQPQGAPFKMEWLAPAIEGAYSSTVDFAKSVVVDPATLSRAPDAGGRDPILDTEPMAVPDQSVAITDPTEFLRQGERYLKDRITREVAQKRQRGAGGSRA